MVNRSSIIRLAAVLAFSSVLVLVSRLTFAYGYAQNEPVDQAGVKAASTQIHMQFEIPQPLVAEHKELHDELQQAISSGGKTGAAAKAVEMVLHPHFLKEEAYALPPLGLLPALARGDISPGMAQVLPMTDKLKQELPRMLAEHREILAALQRLAEAARAENKPEVVAFAHALIQHALIEEQIMYPTAILIGEYLKLKLKN